MSTLIDHLAGNPELLDREIGKEIARRLASVDARSRGVESKLDKLAAMFDAKAARMVSNGYRLDLARSRLEESAL